ncbi:MAG TPA: protein phosphatase 2C domain-containing protein [Gemmataceae bacterium]|nr:protein phosphatase 2C domain-containing protein [Gemmataceae bacterium]
MSTQGSEPNPPQPTSSLQSMLARLRGMMQTLKSNDPPPGKVDESRTELLPTWDLPKFAEASPQPASAGPDEGASLPVAEVPTSPPVGSLDAVPGHAAAVEPERPPEVGGILCQACCAMNPAEQTYCEACGWIFPPPGTSAPATEPARIRNRYQLIKMIGERGACQLFQAIDQTEPETTALAVLVLREPRVRTGSEPVSLEPAPIEAKLAETDTQSDTALTPAEAAPLPSKWPSSAWFLDRVELSKHGTWPRYGEQFEEGDFAYLVLEAPNGLSLWDAWDDPAATEAIRFRWLIQIAETMQELHARGAVLEALRPEHVLIAPDGRVRISDLTQLLPCPLPAEAQLRAGLYSAPELVLASDKTDARSDLYAFGAMLYALHLGRELTETDFELQGVPKPILQQFADCHPLFGRLISKTFCRDVNLRFPTAEACREDPTGFTELLGLLRKCQASLDRVRLEVGAWSSTGMVRSGNEDAFAVLQVCQCFEDGFEDHVLLLAADGMGGSDAGEVAARMTIQSLLKKVASQKPWSLVGSQSKRDSLDSGITGHFLDSATVRLSLIALISEVNKEVYAAAREEDGRRGMGCTLEFVYLGGDFFAVGHVGDSRTYHLHRGQLRQVTEDQTWVQRMVALGAMTQQEATEHPRRSELQQAMGGQPDVQPVVYEGRLVPGDAILVCSDGVTNHLPPVMLQEILQRNTSAEACARQIINWTNLYGGTDNSTALVVRAR